MTTTSEDDLTVHLDTDSKNNITRAAALRGISIDEYIRNVVVAQARREIDAAAHQIIALTPEEQLAFWQALNEPVKLTENQKALGALMRGE